MQKSLMLKNIKAKYPERNYPSALGERWSKEEDQNLLNEVKENLDVKTIANNHNRTIGGIKARIEKIAYDMHKNNANIDDIIISTKLTEKQILEIVRKKQEAIELKLAQKPVIEKSPKSLIDKIPNDKPLYDKSPEPIQIIKKRREEVWDTWIGPSIGIINCLVCNKVPIKQGACNGWDCGHVTSRKNDGNISVENLRPICKGCNSSMGALNMKEYCEKYEPNAPVLKTLNEIKTI
jgi:5-methylcytosine-specific restriction endonuclease McrA